MFPGVKPTQGPGSGRSTREEVVAMENSYNLVFARLAVDSLRRPYNVGCAGKEMGLGRVAIDDPLKPSHLPVAFTKEVSGNQVIGLVFRAGVRPHG